MILRSRNITAWACIGVILAAVSIASAREIHVAKTGNDAQPGQPREPVPDDRQVGGSGPAGRYGNRSRRNLS